MPVEFSVAAYRLGHSMVRPGYRLNDNGVAVTETVSVVPPSGGVAVAVAENAAVEDPARTLTEAGTVNAGLLAETDTVRPPVGAGTERVRGQVEEEAASRVVAL